MIPDVGGMPYTDFLNAVIDDGIEEVRTAYADPKAVLRLEGCIKGFEDCRGKDPDALLELLASAESDAMARMRDQAADYWFWRSRALQVAWTLNVVNAPRWARGEPVNFNPTHRGLTKAADILGVAAA